MQFDDSIHKYPTSKTKINNKTHQQLYQICHCVHTTPPIPYDLSLEMNLEDQNAATSKKPKSSKKMSDKERR